MRGTAGRVAALQGPNSSSKRIGYPWESLEYVGEKTYLALAANLLGAVNPDVLGNDGTLLVEIKVFLELFRVSIEGAC